jgi:hypothetical protein
MSVKPVLSRAEGYDCGCDFCRGEACSSCPDCLDSIYEYDHPGMETFMFGSFPPPVSREVVDTDTPRKFFLR